MPCSCDQTHPCLGRGLVERRRIFAFVRSCEAFDQAVREVGLTCREETYRLPDSLRVLDDKLLRAQDSLQHRNRLVLCRAIAFFQHPNQLGQNDGRDEARSRLATFVFYQVNGLGRLSWVVLRNVADENIGIEPDHRPDPRRLIAAFMASTETGFCGRRIMPLSVRTSSVAAL